MIKYLSTESKKKTDWFNFFAIALLTAIVLLSAFNIARYFYDRALDDYPNAGEGQGWEMEPGYF